MALLTFNNLTGLDVSFNGEPFCNISTGTSSSDGLDTAYDGEPFYGTEAGGGGGDIEIQAPAGIITTGGVFSGISVCFSMLPGVIAASANCGEIKTYVSGNIIEIRPEAGTVAASGLVEGVKVVISLPVGRADTDGWCGNVAKITVVNAVPGEISASVVVSGIRHKIGVPVAQMVSGADISGLICVLAATPATVLLTGGIGRCRRLSVTTGVQRRYECKIQCVGFADAIVPISAFTSRQRDGSPSYSEVTIPGLRHLTQILKRTDGCFKVSVIIAKGDETLFREDIFTSPIDTMTVTGNDRTQTIMLSGNRPASENTGQQIIPIRGVNYRRLSNGEISLRSVVTDLYLKPGDTVIYDGDSFTARTITYSFSSGGCFMEVNSR